MLCCLIVDNYICFIIHFNFLFISDFTVTAEIVVSPVAVENDQITVTYIIIFYTMILMVRSRPYLMENYPIGFRRFACEIRFND